ncbi:unnamed protein product [Eruca vesicaria subsp. sativa]|uniref:Sec16 Sec23-binding domain-containing protein n=1 Tax=Eruca vesicaria subsp. sativa TaxID=29727 RepID=A0ABC8KIJ9_ERUVS|nr:unnamed protein product [Eruca vesicaria subsp. sativa]
MSCIKRVERSAYVAMAPEAPFMAAGTMAGAVDLSFSSSSKLEIFELDFHSEDQEMKLLGQCSSSERFTRLAWGRSYGSGSEESPYGLIAGGLVDGSIGLWNPLSLIRSEFNESVHVRYLSKHKGPVCALEFNVLSPNQLASGDDDGMICIWDFSNPSEPSHVLKASGSYTQSEISSVSWNRKFKHVLASTSYNGTTGEFKNSESSDRFKGLISCSVLQWDPDNCNQIMIASDDDYSPSVKVINLVNVYVVQMVILVMLSGVIAMEWCPSDSLYLLTCGRDNRTICWNTKTGQIVTELPTTVNNSNFDVHWSPKMPGVVSASSADGQISVYNLEGCSSNGSGENNLLEAAPLTAPKWWKRPVSASFGFGGKLVSSNSKLPEASVVFLHSLATEQSLVNRISEFDAALGDGEKTSLRSLCKKKSEETESEEEKETWSLLQLMLEEAGNAKTKLHTHFGFSLPSEDQNDQAVATYSSENVEETQQESSDPLLDEAIQRSLIVGDYKEAVAHCLSANKMADALVIAHVGGTTLWESTLDKYLKMSNAPYMKVVSAMVNKDLMSLVHTRPAKFWKETLALICTFAEGDEWTRLCDALASHLLSSGFTLAATLCYICAGNVDKTVDIWSMSLVKDNAGKSYSERVQDLMEKTIVLALATENKRFSASLLKLFESYAEILASQGLIATAIKLLKLLELGDSSPEISILRERFSQSVYQEPTQTQPNVLTSPYNQAQPVLQPSFTTTSVTNAQPSRTTLVSPNPSPPQQRTMDSHSSTRSAYSTYNPPQGPGSHQPTCLYLNSKIHQNVVPPVELMVPTQRVVIQPPPAPVAPPPTVQTADTSNVPAHQKHIVATLTRLFRETSKTLGSDKKIEDTSRKLGALFSQLNNKRISNHAAEKLSLLCQALDKHDFGAALQIQARMTSTEWDECNFWLGPLKQMIRERQNVR